MSMMVQLVRDSLNAPTLDQRVRAAEELACHLITELRAFLMRNEPPEVAEEALQEALAAIFKSLPKFRGAFDPAFWAWCHRIARNKASDQWRQPWVQRREALDTEALWSLVEASAQVLPLAPQERQDLQYTLELVRRAKPPCYYHLYNHFILGWDYKEIARVNRITYGAAKVTVRRCLELARALVKQGD